MKINRVDRDRTEKDVERIEISIGDDRYTITESFGRLKIHAHDESMDIKPCCANQITVKGLTTA